MNCIGIEIGSLPISASTVDWGANIYSVQLATAGSKSYQLLSRIHTLIPASLLLPASSPPFSPPSFPSLPCRPPSSSCSVQVSSPAKPPLPCPSPAAQLPVSPAWDTELVGSDSTPYQYTCCWVSSTILLSFSCSSAPCVTCMGHRASGE